MVSLIMRVRGCVAQVLEPEPEHELHGTTSEDMLQRTLGGMEDTRTATDKKITELMTLTRLAHEEMHRLREQNGALHEQYEALVARVSELEAAGAKADHDIMDALKARRSDILHSDS